MNFHLIRSMLQCQGGVHWKSADAHSIWQPILQSHNHEDTCPPISQEAVTAFIGNLQQTMMLHGAKVGKKKTKKTCFRKAGHKHTGWQFSSHPANRSAAPPAAAATGACEAAGRHWWGGGEERSPSPHSPQAESVPCIYRQFIMEERYNDAFLCYWERSPKGLPMHFHVCAEHKYILYPCFLQCFCRQSTK